jgi:hypothetical protein
MRRSAGKGTDGGHIGDGGAVPVIVGYPCLPPMLERQGASRPSPRSRLQPTPSPDRSPDPARQPALAPGLSLVPHGCGDPLIRLVQEPRNNRVLEGWCARLHAEEAAPCVREAGGQGRLSCRARGPVAKVTTGFKGAGVSKEGPRSFVRPLFGRSTAKRSNEGVRGRSPRLRRRRSGLRPARVGRGRRGPTAPYLVQCPSRHSAERPRYFTFSSGVK